MASGMFVYAAVDTQAKLLTGSLHPIQIAWSRQTGLLLGAFILLAMRGPSVFRTRYPARQVLRGALVAASATLFIAAVHFVPLADAVAVTFVAPFIVTVLGALLLREPVGPRRWTAVAIGFAGALIVIRPGMGVFHPAMLLVLLAAAFFAFRQVLSRMVSADSTETTIVYTALIGSLILTVPLPFVWQSPTTFQEVALLVGMGLLAAVGEILVIRALETTEAVVLAPVHYSMLIWGTIYGFLVFGDFPDAWTWVGALIIVASGAYTLYRERVVARRTHRPAPPIDVTNA